MASDLSLIIFDPQVGCVVRERWLGMNGTVQRARAVLGRPADRDDVGHECWRVRPGEACEIAKAHYANGATAAEVQRLSEAFPEPQFWWYLERDG